MVAGHTADASGSSYVLSMDADGWVCLWDSSSWCCLDMQRAAPLPPGVTPVLLNMVRAWQAGSEAGKQPGRQAGSQGKLYGATATQQATPCIREDRQARRRLSSNSSQLVMHQNCKF